MDEVERATKYAYGSSPDSPLGEPDSNRWSQVICLGRMGRSTGLYQAIFIVSDVGVINPNS